MKINDKLFLLLILLLCVVILLFCVFYFPVFSSISPSCGRQIEGMGSPGGNKTYVYSPDGTSSGIQKNIRLSDLKHETYEAVEFLKQRKGLVYQAPAPPVSETMEPPPTAQAIEAEKKDAEEVGGQLKEMEDKLESLIDMTRYNSEYSKDVNTSDLYKTYNDFNTNITNEMDKEFADLFLSENIEKRKIETFSRFKDKIMYYDTAYNYTKFFLIPSTGRRDYVQSEFTNYWVGLIEKHSDKQSTLDEIKQKLYAILQPTFIFTRLCSYYKENKKMFSHRDDALLIVNIAAQTIRELKYDALKPNHDQIISALPNDKEDQRNVVLHLDTIQYTDIACIVYQIVLMIAYNVNEFFGSDFKDFKTNYETYVKKKGINSFYLFLMEHPPKLSSIEHNPS